jgi:hypothetical protein
VDKDKDAAAAIEGVPRGWFYISQKCELRFGLFTENLRKQFQRKYLNFPTTFPWDTAKNQTNVANLLAELHSLLIFEPWFLQVI